MIERCARCDGPMKEGFVLDNNRHAPAVAHWAEGKPEYSFLRTLKMRGRKKLPVRTFRCSRCGYLESYAVEPPH